jgi:hypothetical protein
MEARLVDGKRVKMGGRGIGGRMVNALGSDLDICVEQFSHDIFHISTGLWLISFLSIPSTSFIPCERVRDVMKPGSSLTSSLAPPVGALIGSILWAQSTFHYVNSSCKEAKYCLYSCVTHCAGEIAGHNPQHIQKVYCCCKKNLDTV